MIVAAGRIARMGLFGKRIKSLRIKKIKVFHIIKGIS